MVHGPLHLGHALLRRGDIHRARRHFRACLNAGLPEAALALAGTYNPTVLGASNSSHADTALAETWYREWHRLSVEQGNVAPSVDLRQLLDALATD